MIKLEVTNSNDIYAIGPYQYEFDTVYVGRSKKNDLIFKDHELPLRYLFIKVFKDVHGHYLMAKSVGDQSYFFLNGKKVKGTLRLREQDVISFGKNEIKIIEFKQTDNEVDLSEYYEEFSSNHKELKLTLEFIEEKIIQLENQK